MSDQEAAAIAGANEPLIGDGVTEAECGCDDFQNNDCLFCSPPPACKCCLHALCKTCNRLKRRCSSCNKVMCKRCAVNSSEGLNCHVCLERNKLIGKTATQLAAMSEADARAILMNLHIYPDNPKLNRQDQKVIKALEKCKIDAKTTKEYKEVISKNKRQQKPNETGGSTFHAAEENQTPVPVKQQLPSVASQSTTEQNALLAKEATPSNNAQPKKEVTSKKSGRKDLSPGKTDKTSSAGNKKIKNSQEKSSGKSTLTGDSKSKSKPKKTACSCGQLRSKESGSFSKPKKTEEINCSCCQQYSCKRCRKECSTCYAIICQQCRVTNVDSKVSTKCHRCVMVGQLSGKTLTELSAIPPQESMESLKSLHQDEKKLKSLDQRHLVEELLRVCKMEEKRQTFAKNMTQTALVNEEFRRSIHSLSKSSTLRQETPRDSPTGSKKVPPLPPLRSDPSRYEKGTDVPSDWSDSGSYHPEKYKAHGDSSYENFDIRKLPEYQSKLSHLNSSIEQPRESITTSGKPLPVTVTNAAIFVSSGRKKLEEEKVHDFTTDQSLQFEHSKPTTDTDKMAETATKETSDQQIKNRFTTFDARPTDICLEDINDVSIIATLSVAELKTILTKLGLSVRDYTEKKDFVDKVTDLWNARAAVAKGVEVNNPLDNDEQKRDKTDHHIVNSLTRQGLNDGIERIADEQNASTSKFLDYEEFSHVDLLPPPLPPISKLTQLYMDLKSPIAIEELLAERNISQYMPNITEAHHSDIGPFSGKDKLRKDTPPQDETSEPIEEDVVTVKQAHNDEVKDKPFNNEKRHEDVAQENAATAENKDADQKSNVKAMDKENEKDQPNNEEIQEIDIREAAEQKLASDTSKFFQEQHSPGAQKRLKKDKPLQEEKDQKPLQEEKDQKPLQEEKDQNPFQEKKNQDPLQDHKPLQDEKDQCPPQNKNDIPNNECNEKTEKSEEVEQRMPGNTDAKPDVQLSFLHLSDEELVNLPIREMRKILINHSVDSKDCVERVDVLKKLTNLRDMLLKEEQIRDRTARRVVSTLTREDLIENIKAEREEFHSKKTERTPSSVAGRPPSSLVYIAGRNRDSEVLDDELPPPPPPPPFAALGIASEEDIQKLPIDEIKKLLAENGIDFADESEKPELVFKLVELWKQLGIGNEELDNVDPMDADENCETYNVEQLRLMLRELYRQKKGNQILQTFQQIISENDGVDASDAIKEEGANAQAPPPPPAAESALGIASLDDIGKLSTREIRKLLTDNAVDFEGCFEKQELVAKLAQLWNDLNKHSGEIPEADRCLVCMDARIDCVFLECGHMATCHECGHKIKDCPVCRTYIVRVVRSYRA